MVLFSWSVTTNCFGLMQHRRRRSWAEVGFNMDCGLGANMMQLQHCSWYYVTFSSVTYQLRHQLDGIFFLNIQVKMIWSQGNGWFISSYRQLNLAAIPVDNLNSTQQANLTLTFCRCVQTPAVIQPCRQQQLLRQTDVLITVLHPKGELGGVAVV